ncbi:hypothetical protein AQ477_28880 [Burkholderia thailandensis]|nr:hypothetical protein AQ477_28880 [Burkholderia thailandensis]KXF57438.1 hypothetical protein AQ476_21775 [Burkholderia thailandensis]
MRSPLTAARATFALNAAECVRRVLFVIFWVPLPALSLAQAPGIPLTRLSEFARPPLSENIGRAHAMRNAARMKLDYDRRLYLRSVGLKV